MNPGADAPRLTFQRVVYVLVLTTVDDDVCPAPRRLAQLLKTALRRDRLRCVYAVEADTRGAQTARDHARHALDLVQDLADARAEIHRLRGIIDSLAERVAGQAQLLARHAERPQPQRT